MAVVRIEIDRREPVLNGASFGEAGAYEKVVGMLHFAVDPSLPVNERIADIQRAPRNAQGAVLSSADFYLLRPVGGGSLFPFTDAEQEDPLTGQRGALLWRVSARARPPKIFSTNSSAEYWRGDASLIHTDVSARRDVEPPDHVRHYLFAGTQHTPGTIPRPSPIRTPAPAAGTCSTSSTTRRSCARPS